MNKQILILFLILVLALSCDMPQPGRKKIKAKQKTQQADIPLPVLTFKDTLDHCFVLTNKISGLFSGHSRKENTKPDEGWLIGTTSILSDYQIFVNSNKIKRKNIKYFRYLPFGFERFYKNGMVEKFLMVDSIDAFIVQIENRTDVSLSVQNGNHTVRINEQNPRFSAGGGYSLEIYYKKVSDEVSRFWFVRNRSLTEDTLTRETYKSLLKKAAVKAKHKELNSGNKLLDRAALWAGYTLNAQTGLILETGTAGESVFRGRDIFISFSGALLLKGKFSTAGHLLTKYASLQLKDKSRREYGRIANRNVDGENQYNSAAVTWWFIRALYDYYLFSGDKELIVKLFPAVRQAVEGALEKRCDKSFFLTHSDAETWMDAQNSKGAWSPRGNRAVEIQALWYMALQISAKMVRISNADEQLSTSWLKISRQLRESFNALFWDKNREALYDHLTAGGQADTSLRPNQIFAVTVPDMYGVEALLSPQKQRAVAQVVTGQLTLPSGVLTLSQEDNNFHPFYHYLPYYSPQAARFNGMIWSGLNGPVLSSLVQFNQIQTAQELLLNEARQILKGNPLGGLAQLAEPVVRPGKTEAETFGSLQSIWGLAEFKRNLMQDILGYHPAAGDSLVVFRPHLPGKIHSVQTRVPYKNGRIKVSLFSDKGTMDITLCSEIKEKIYGRLEFSGDRQAVDFTLQDSGAVFQYTYVPKAKPEIPPSKIKRKWTFATIDSGRHFPVIAAPEFVILKTRQVFLLPGKNGYTLLFKRDALNDDHGENGLYVYPGNKVSVPGVLDLESFTIYDMQDSWGFRVKLRNMIADGVSPFLAFAIREEDISGSVKRDVEKGALCRLSKERAFNRIIYAGAGLEIQDGLGKRLARFIPIHEKLPLAFPAERQVRFKIPKEYLPGLNVKSRITILCGAQGTFNGSGSGEFRSAKIKTADKIVTRKDLPAVYDRMDIN